jgi:hypothetical protein
MMKKLFLIVTLLFWAGTLLAQQKQTPLQAAQAEIARLNVVLEDVKAERNQLILTIAEMNRNIIEQNAGLEKTRLILQDAINNGGKVDWKTLINDVKWNLVLTDSTGFNPGKAKKE